MSVKKEMDVICKALREDKDYYYGWQSNIAMAFYDEIERIDSCEILDKDTLITAANKAAKNFLNMLIKEY